MLPNALVYNAQSEVEAKTNVSTELDWDGEISGEAFSEPALLEGEYDFTVTGMKRDRFNGSEKLEPCHKAVLNLDVVTDQGVVKVNTDLMLSRKLEFKLVQFFSSIGQMKAGEKKRMDWNSVVGSRGRAIFAPRVFIDRYGNEKKVNNIEKYIVK